MRAAFVNNLRGSYGLDPVANPAFTDKVTKYGLQGLAFPAGTATYDDLQAIRARGISVWTMRDPHWNGAGPITLADEMFADLRQLAPNNEQLTLCGDIEYHDPNFVIAWYLRLRDNLTSISLTQSRRIIWTLEGMQGGWFTHDLVNLINADPLFLVLPQQYIDGTRDHGTAAQVLADITSRGVNPAQVKIVQRGGELTPATFPDGAAWTLDEGAPWGLS